MELKQLYTSIDLFSGPGGLCTGFKWAGIKPLIAVELSDWTIETYKASHNADVLHLDTYLNGTLEHSDSFFLPNTKTLLIHGDIRKVSNDLIDKILLERFGVNTVDIVTGGSPCESFSLAGDRKEEDERNNLFLNLARIAKHTDASMILFENVKGLLSKKSNGIPGKMYQDICDHFETPSEEGVSFKLVSRDKSQVLLKASDYGTPQDRERVILIGINSRLNTTFQYPEKTHGIDRKYPYVTVSDALDDLPQYENPKEGEEEVRFSSVIKESFSEQRKKFLKIISGIKHGNPEHLSEKAGVINSHITPGHTLKMIERFKNILPGEGMKRAADRLIAEGKEAEVFAYFPKKLYAARNRRLIENRPSFTVTSHCLDEMVHPKYNRALSPREAARLQSFPDWYQFKGPYVKFHSDPEQDRYEQIGDAIPPLLAYVLGKEVVRTLGLITEKDELKEIVNV
jgi:DNA (cytosine-5)-methyltransferase 1